MQPNTITPVLLLLALLSGCGNGDYIISGRSENPCLETIPACPGRYAECVLDPGSYAEREFPGQLTFLVDVEAEHDLEVVLFFAEQRDTGFETSIEWNEPGCADAYFYDSQGADLFAEAKGTSVITRTQKLQETGEHLVEILSDMQALVLVTVNIIVPGTR